MAGNLWRVLVGVALLAGAAIRWTALAGTLMLMLFYVAKPPPMGAWVSQQIIYIIALNLLAAARAGTFYGVDGLLERVEKRLPALRYVLG